MYTCNTYVHIHTFEAICVHVHMFLASKVHLKLINIVLSMRYIHIMNTSICKVMQFKGSQINTSPSIKEEKGKFVIKF